MKIVKDRTIAPSEVPCLEDSLDTWGEGGLWFGAYNIVTVTIVMHLFSSGFNRVGPS